ncbi:B-cell receptor CD22-like isoform X2 [Synchiropus splendidus]|uniref:B-cell receptor CD22-like isoform X2 n=1 Tax=Synchiropus splendidus TaxID=270530 RepID=UPI00237E6BCB|nr:B-cell receptor CD22-like isoform X2 [Synchiropus splendidus]
MEREKLCLLLLLTTIRANPCLIRFEEPAPVTESSSVTLRCSTSSSCPSRPQIQPLDQRGISVQPQGDGHSRTATSNFIASWQDNGRQFSCQTRGNTDPNLIRSVTLTVEYGPRNVEVRVTNPNRREGVAAEDTVTLTCSASGNPAPTYHWFRPGQAGSEGQDLIIPSITVSQSGRYRCEARNKHGHEDSSLDLDVQFSPEVEITASATSIRQGQKMDLRCTVKRSSPDATSFQWQKDQRDVSSAQTYTVTSIQPEHAGFYTCTAWNSIGAGTSDPLQIQVEYRPKNTRIQVPSGLNGRVSAGKELRLTCVTEASPAAHSFSWLHGSSRHTPLSHYWHIDSRNTMTIKNVQRSDEGCYMCSATNSIGTDYSAPQCFQVQYAPSNLKLSMYTQVTEGQTFTIRCTVDSFPPSTLTLIREIQSSSVNVFSNSNKNGVHNNDLVYTTKAAVHHAGSYKCIASNSEGSRTSQRRELVVKFSPEVEITASATSIQRGQRMDLRCTVKRSNPDATSFHWKKGRQYVSMSQTYTVRSIQPEHAGSYTCTARNSIGAGTSDLLQIQVEYGPRNTRVQVPSGLNGRVSAGKELRLTCVTQASPAAHSFSWLHGSSRHTPLSKYQSKYWGSTMTIETVQRSDEGCYKCCATNSIGRDYSAPQCFQVQYAPTDIILSMYTQVTEGQTFIINCTVDSFPPSTLTLIRETGSSSVNVHNNVLVYTTKAAVHHAGSYKCIASNSEGSRTSERGQLVVQYSPKNVAVIIDPRETVKENTSVTFRCSAQSHPPVTSVTWTKMADGQEEVLMRGQSFTLRSVAPSDSGWYRCNVRNEVGSGESPPVHVMILYAPKETKVLKAEELQLPDKRSSVMLTCSSSSYPPIHRYSWYRKSTDDRGDDKVSDQQNHSVTSDKPGIYYCSALNQLGERRSDPVELFVEGASHKVLKYVFISASLLLIPLAAGLIFIKCKRRLKHRANPSAERPLEVQAVPPEEASVVYANVHYAKGKPGQDVVYAVVSKPHRFNKPSGEEGEEEVNYSHVEFKHNRVKHKIGKSSRCEDENTEYSTIKF